MTSSLRGLSEISASKVAALRPSYCGAAGRNVIHHIEMTKFTRRRISSCIYGTLGKQYGDAVIFRA